MSAIPAVLKGAVDRLQAMPGYVTLHESAHDALKKQELNKRSTWHLKVYSLLGLA